MNIQASAGAATHHSQNIQIAKKAQDLQKAEGQAAVGLIEAARNVQQQAQSRAAPRVRLNVVV